MALNKSAAVGGFVIGAIALGVVGILLFGGTRLLTTNLRVVVFFQDSVAGLEVGAPVTLRGVKVGTVSSMKVYLKLPELVPVIPVYLDIEPGMVSWTKGTLRAGKADVERAVAAGLRAQLSPQSLVTGQLSINLDFYPNTPAKLVGTGEDVPEIPSMPSDLQNIKNQIADLKLPELAEQARVALAGINRLVGELGGKLGPMADSLRETSDIARTTLETTTASVRQLQLDASQTLGDIDHLAVATQGQVGTTGKQIDVALAGVNRTMAKAETVIGSLNDLTAPRAPMRSDLEAAIRDLAASASSLREFSHELVRNPNTLLLGRASR
ncbi:MAG: MlaD family protein [Acetobacteraceae bacterium]|jgi:paraquat-inducible protein B